MSDIHYLTKDGLQKFEEELADLLRRQRLVSQRIKEAIEMGDLSENAEYSDAKDEQAFIGGRLVEVKNVIKNAQLIDGKKNSNGEIRIGSSVSVKSEQLNKTFTIVGAEEANPAEGKISHESPLGSAFIGHKKGDAVEVETPAGKMNYKITKVE